MVICKLDKLSSANTLCPLFCYNKLKTFQKFYFSKPWSTLLKMIDKLLDASLFWSFDHSGFVRHAKAFDETYQFPSGAKALITGGTSGIGAATALELANFGVDVTVTGRDQKKAISFTKNHSGLKFLELELSDWDRIGEAALNVDALDYLVLNAGGMPERFETNAQGVELQFASQLFGHYILSKKLQGLGKLKPKCRIVWVTSGGMYLKALDLSTIFTNEGYDKVSTYANVKRAQVTLLPFFKNEFPEQVVTAMHPGWAQTPGVKESIPVFNRLMKGRLRTPLEGADTILWLLGTKKHISSGGLYFDRRKVTEHLLSFTKKSEDKKTELEGLLRDSLITLRSREM